MLLLLLLLQAAVGTPDDLLTQLSTALFMLTSTPSNTELVFDDILIRFEEILRTANCGLAEPIILSDNKEHVDKEIAVTQVDIEVYMSD